MTGTALRVIRFALVGATGLFINSLILALVTERLGVYYLAATVLATLGSTLWNFVLTELWVFGDRRGSGGSIGRFPGFLAMNTLALALIRWPLMSVLTTVLQVHYLISNGISILTLFIARYAFADAWLWRSEIGHKKKMVGSTAIHKYSIHGLLTVVSPVALPELEPFRVEALAGAPSIVVEFAPYRVLSAQAGSERCLNYGELPGPFGFWAQILWGVDMVTVKASPWLRWSPHVLYTNLVEPILRWTFVQHGYALVHAACLTLDSQAYLITARTDTGKTTTLLKILRAQSGADDTPGFIADDLTLVSPTGQVLSYPKPFTISAHTLRAIDADRLPWLERIGLLIQSQIHSRHGRRAAHSMSRLPLPMATINAMTQAVIPPPKYAVQKLVPAVRMAQTGQIAGMFIIQGGAPDTRQLAAEEGLQILLENCEDAYGFPPYRSMEPLLRVGAQGQDLRPIERAIIAQALGDVPVFQLSHPDKGWATEILARFSKQMAHPQGASLWLNSQA